MNLHPFISDDERSAACASAEPQAPTPVQRLDSAAADLEKVEKLLEQLWLQRHMLYSAIREIGMVKRNLELTKNALSRSKP